MYSFQKLKYILTQKEATKRPDLLEEITQQLEYGISQKKLSKIWIVNNNNKDKFIELNGDGIKLNVKNKDGKQLLTKIIGFCAKKYAGDPVIFVVESDHIPVRKIIFDVLKKVFKNDIENEIFQYMLRCFIIVTEKHYKRLTQNNKYQLFLFE